MRGCVEEVVFGGGEVVEGLGEGVLIVRDVRVG